MQSSIYNMYILDRNTEELHLALTREGSSTILYVGADSNKTITRMDSQEERKRLQTMSAKEIKVHGLFGRIDLAVGSYLILIDNSEQVDSLLSAGVFRVNSLVFVPLHKSMND
jgi:hypothetical protein